MITAVLFVLTLMCRTAAAHPGGGNGSTESPGQGSGSTPAGASPQGTATQHDVSLAYLNQTNTGVTDKEMFDSTSTMEYPSTSNYDYSDVEDSSAGFNTTSVTNSVPSYGIDHPEVLTTDDFESSSEPLGTLPEVQKTSPRTTTRLSAVTAPPGTSQGQTAMLTMSRHFTWIPTRSEIRRATDVTDGSFLFSRIPANRIVEPPDSDISQFNISSPSGENISLERADLLERFKNLYPLHLWRVYGLFNDTFLKLVDNLWLRAPPPSPIAHYVLAALYCIIMTVGVAGNGIVIFLYIRSRSLRTPANILVLNLAISDLFLMLNMALFIYNSVLLGPALGDIGCQLYGFTGGLTGSVSIMTLALIAWDRYNVIVFPMEPFRKTSKARAKAMVVGSWLYSSVFSVLPLVNLGIRPYTPEGYLTSCSFDYLSPDFSNKVYILAFFAAVWVVPLVIITFCYSQICQAVLRTSEITTAAESQRHCKEEEKRKSEVKLAGVVAGVVGLWFVAWTPYATVALLGVAGQHHLITPLSSMVPALFCKTASCIDPFVYAVTHPRFRKELISMLRRVPKKKRSAPQPHGRHKKRCWTVAGDATLQRRGTEQSQSSEVEEVLVMIEGDDGASSDSQSSLGSTTDASKRTRKRKLSQRISWTVDQPFPFPNTIAKQLQPPSWFVPPRNKKNLSTSLRLKERPPATEPGPPSM